MFLLHFWEPLLQNKVKNQKEVQKSLAAILNTSQPEGFWWVLLYACKGTSQTTAAAGDLQGPRRLRIHHPPSPQPPEFHTPSSLHLLLRQMTILFAPLTTPQYEDLPGVLLHAGYLTKQSESLPWVLLYTEQQNPQSDGHLGDLLQPGQQISSLSAAMKIPQSECLPWEPLQPPVYMPLGRPHILKASHDVCYSERHKPTTNPRTQEAGSRQTSPVQLTPEINGLLEASIGP